MFFRFVNDDPRGDGSQCNAMPSKYANIPFQSQRVLRNASLPVLFPAGWRARLGSYQAGVVRGMTRSRRTPRIGTQPAYRSERSTPRLSPAIVSEYRTALTDSDVDRVSTRRTARGAGERSNLLHAFNRWSASASAALRGAQDFLPRAFTPTFILVAPCTAVDPTFAIRYVGRFATTTEELVDFDLNTILQRMRFCVGSRSTVRIGQFGVTSQQRPGSLVIRREHVMASVRASATGHCPEDVEGRPYWTAGLVVEHNAAGWDACSTTPAMNALIVIKSICAAPATMPTRSRGRFSERD